MTAPLISLLAATGGTVEILTSLADYASTTIAPGFRAVGAGIGAIMLLIVVIYYMASILDGGKFQIKMLMPLLIFLFVCNFNWISTPVLAFTKTITSSITATLDNQKKAIAKQETGHETANFNDIINFRRNKNQTKEDRENVNDMIGEDKGVTENSSSDDKEKDKGKFAWLKPKAEGGWISKGVKRGGVHVVNQMNYDAQVEMGGVEYASAQEENSQKPYLSSANLGIAGFISSIISWVCTIMSYVLKAFGGIMTGIIVAFGPITFAFAIFPGQGGTIKSWFIRLCQFSIWAPICALVDCFSYKIMTLFDMSMGAGSAMLAITVAACNLLALTSVPTIASMIIEGASGSATLSSGLQTLGHTLSMIKTAAVLGAKGAKFVFGNDSNPAGNAGNNGNPGAGGSAGEGASAGTGTSGAGSAAEAPTGMAS